MQKNQSETTQNGEIPTVATATDEKKKKSRRRTYSDRINEAKLIVAGAQENIEQLWPGGLNQDYINLLIAQREKVETLNADQEKRKADLKSSTQFLNEELKQLNNLVRDARYIVKMRVSISRWKAFGIVDKR